MRDVRSVGLTEKREAEGGREEKCFLGSRVGDAAAVAAAAAAVRVILAN